MGRPTKVYLTLLLLEAGNPFIADHNNRNSADKQGSLPSLWGKYLLQKQIHMLSIKWKSHMKIITGKVMSSSQNGFQLCPLFIFPSLTSRFSHEDNEACYHDVHTNIYIQEFAYTYMQILLLNQSVVGFFFNYSIHTWLSCFGLFIQWSTYSTPSPMLGLMDTKLNQ